MIRSIGGRNEELSIVSGFDRAFYDAFKNALERGQVKAQLQVLRFVEKQMIQAFGRNSTAVMQQLNWLPAAIYNLSSGNTEASKTVAIEFGSFFKTVSWFFKSDDPNKDPIHEYPVRFHLYFTTLMNFYHYAIHHPDEAVVRSILKDFEGIGDPDYDSDIRVKIQYAGEISQVEKLAIRKQFTKKHLLMITKRRCALVLVSWLTFLYIMDKVSEERFKFLLQQLNLKYHFFEELLDDLDYIRSNEASGFLGIDFWDYMERESGVSYSPPQVYDWIVYGPTLLLLSQPMPNFNQSVIVDDRQHAFLLEAFKVKLNIFEAQLTKFASVFGWNLALSTKSQSSIAEQLLSRFNERKEQIIFIFESVKVLNEEEENRQLIARPLDHQSIYDFYDTLFDKWVNNCISYSFFRSAGNINIVSNSENLDYHGQSTLLEHQRVMFVEGDKQTIYGSDDLGIAAARTVDEQFILKITKVARQQKTNYDTDFDSVTSGLDASISTLRKSGYEPDMIILSPQPFYKSDLVSSKKYQRAEFLNKGQEIGVYDGIPVVRLFAKGLESKAVITTFRQGLSLTLFEDTSLFNNVYHLSLRELPVEEIENEYNLDSKRWTTNSDGIQLTEVQAKLRLAASLVLEMWTRGKFEILNPQAITWCKFKPIAITTQN